MPPPQALALQTVVMGRTEGVAWFTSRHDIFKIGSKRSSGRHGPRLRTDIESDVLATRAVHRLTELWIQTLEARTDTNLQLSRHSEMIGKLPQLAITAWMGRAIRAGLAPGTRSAPPCGRRT
jgi:hypothetical protein